MQNHPDAFLELDQHLFSSSAMSRLCHRDFPLDALLDPFRQYGSLLLLNLSQKQVT